MKISIEGLGVHSYVWPQVNSWAAWVATHAWCM